MRKLILCLAAVLLLLCLSSCEDTPVLESGIAAEKNEDTTEGTSDIGGIEDATEGETKSNVSWTPFA